MRDRYCETAPVAFKMGNQRTTPGNTTGERMLADVRGCNAADKPETMLSKAAEISIDARVPVAETGQFGETFDLIMALCAPAAGVDFLQPDHVVLAYQSGNTG